MKKKMKLFYIFMAIMIILGGGFIAPNAAHAGLSVVSVTLKDAPGGNNISAPSTAVPSTQILFDPEGDINTGDGIALVFESDFDVNDVETADVAVTQENDTPDIVTGAVESGFQVVNMLITTESDTPSGAVTIDITNSHITTPTTGGTYTITITIWDLGADNAWGGVGANADTV
ncbi:MAG: hypothetical protein NTX00_04375, partial [Candidatus Parcubacteria bacterium]|nr:hypothetical protein [Candidatus Parcubacteria bacterium]